MITKEEFSIGIQKEIQRQKSQREVFNWLTSEKTYEQFHERDDITDDLQMVRVCDVLDVDSVRT